MNKDEKIHIIIAETSPIISAGLSHTIRRLPGLNIYVTELKSASDMQDCLRSSHPEILIVNPAFCGAFNLSEIRSLKPDLKIIALEVGLFDRNVRTLYDDVVSVIDDIPTIAAKINNQIQIDDDVFNPDTEKNAVSSREKEIIALVAKGLTNKEIADKLFLSVHTVITHRRNIARKLEIHSATGLTIYAIVNKLVDLSEIKL